MANDRAAWCGAVILLILAVYISDSDCDEMVPVVTVMETELSTGVWYSIDLRSKGRLSYSDAKDVENKYNHLVIDRSDLDLCNANPRMQWMFVSSEKKGRYVIRNRKSPNAAIGWAGKSPSGKWVAADLGHAKDPVYQEGGEYRDDVLWRVEKAASGYYNIYNNGFPDNGIMTWSYEGDKKDNNTKYVQIYDTGSPDSSKKDPDYQWKFTRSKNEGSRKNIAGTNLYTGTPYRVHLKSKGLLTWSYSKVSNRYNYIQIVFGDTEKNDYYEGKRYYKDSIWMILPSDETGYYQLMNYGLPDAVITWAGKSPSGKWVVADDGHANDPDYLPGGKYHQDVLWKFVTEEDITDTDQKFVRIYNRRYPGNGIMTWSTEDTGSADRKYCQIYDSGSADSYKHNADYLWQFIPVAAPKSK